LKRGSSQKSEETSVSLNPILRPMSPFSDDILVKRMINAGAFGEVYLAERDEKNVAIKVMQRGYEHLDKYLRKEAEILHLLKGKGVFPMAHITQSESPVHKGKVGLVMERLGPNLKELQSICPKGLTVKTVSRIMIQLISRLEELHKCGIVHRDLKPDNFCLGGKGCVEIYLIDFGLSELYIDTSGLEIEKIPRQPFAGTTRYCSTNAHIGIPQLPRDDLESIGYISLQLLNRELPWMNLKIADDSNKSKHEKYFKLKSEVDLTKLCKGLPNCFVHYLKYCRSLGIYDKPDYSYLKSLFKEFLGDKLEPFCWEKLPEYEKIKKEVDFGDANKSNLLYSWQDLPSESELPCSKKYSSLALTKKP